MKIVISPEELKLLIAVHVNNYSPVGTQRVTAEDVKIIALSAGGAWCVIQDVGAEVQL